MKRLIFAAAFAPILALGCNTLSGQPKMTEVRIKPKVLQPGGTGLIEVSVSDRNDVVDRVEAVAKADPRTSFTLYDNGEYGDKDAGDNTWSRQVDVPFQTPAGTFELEFTAYRSDGLPVEVRDEAGNIRPLRLVLPVEIQPEGG